MSIKKKKIIVGIDPGLSGAIAFVDKKNAFVYDMPLIKINGRWEVDPCKLAFLIGKYYYAINFAVLEDVSAMPGQGVTSTFRFGYGAGVVFGCLKSKGLNVLRVKPAVWKSALGLSKNKRESIALALKLYPKTRSQLKRLKDDGRAEAILLARFGRDTF